MQPTKPSWLLSPPLANGIPLEADTDSPANGDKETAAGAKWQQLIDYQLIEWARDPQQLEDEGIDPPRRETIQRAIRLAQELKKTGAPAPDAVVPDPNGGIVFQRREGDPFAVFHLWDEGMVENRCFRDNRLVERHRDYSLGF